MTRIVERPLRRPGAAARRARRPHRAGAGGARAGRDPRRGGGRGRRRRPAGGARSPAGAASRGPLAGAPGRAVRVPVGPDRPPEATLVAEADRRLGDWERIVLRHAAAVIALELQRDRALRASERRLLRDLVDEVVAGQADERALRRRLRRERARRRRGGRDGLRAGAGDGAARRRHALVGARRRPRRAAAGGGRRRRRGRGRTRGGRPRRRPGGRRPRATHGPRARPLLRGGVVRAGGASGRKWRGARAVAWPRCATSARWSCCWRCRTSAGWSSTPRACWGRSCERRETLLPSLEAFVEASGRWNDAAESLGVHRHTLRHRIRRIERLTGRDLDSARDRVELWLALKARELLQRRRG